MHLASVARISLRSHLLNAASKKSPSFVATKTQSATVFSHINSTATFPDKSISFWDSKKERPWYQSPPPNLADEVKTRAKSRSWFLILLAAVTFGFFAYMDGNFNELEQTVESEMIDDEDLAGQVARFTLANHSGRVQRTLNSEKIIARWLQEFFSSDPGLSSMCLDSFLNFEDNGAVFQKSEFYEGLGELDQSLGPEFYAFLDKLIDYNLLPAEPRIIDYLRNELENPPVDSQESEMLAGILQLIALYQPSVAPAYIEGLAPALGAFLQNADAKELFALSGETRAAAWELLFVSQDRLSPEKVDQIAEALGGRKEEGLSHASVFIANERSNYITREVKKWGFASAWILGRWTYLFRKRTGSFSKLPSALAVAFPATLAVSFGASLVFSSEHEFQWRKTLLNNSQEQSAKSAFVAGLYNAARVGILASSFLLVPYTFVPMCCLAQNSKPRILLPHWFGSE